MGNMQGTQEHYLVTRATASVLGERDEKKRLGLELGWKREGGDSVAAFLPHPGITSRPWILPPIYPDSLGFHLLSCFWPQWLFLLLLLWFFFLLFFFFFFVFFFWFSLVFLFLIWSDLFSPDRFRLGTHFEDLT